MAGEVTRRGFVRGAFAACMSISVWGCGEPAPPVQAKKAFTVKKEGERVVAKTIFPVSKKGTAKKK